MGLTCRCVVLDLARAPSTNPVQRKMLAKRLLTLIVVYLRSDAYNTVDYGDKKGDIITQLFSCTVIHYELEGIMVSEKKPFLQYGVPMMLEPKQIGLGVDR
ncbi:hypothetical protein RSOLAG22IIIB_08630 [Rhizoctonia solani]|uniref:Uncharacterized protein n=1 Tax=Rhizoctonia solani TaxID=456999 RepID=A0A0K6FU66_9AGAM|nr:hypothetical protein RSOLAG22IIIB_08630 [Rhizoctonia solani]